MALNIALTAINSVLAVFILPIVVSLSADYFLADPRRRGEAHPGCRGLTPQAIY